MAVDDSSSPIYRQMQVTEQQGALRDRFVKFLTERGFLLETGLGVDPEEITARHLVVLYLAALKQVLELMREREPGKYEASLIHIRRAALRHLWNRGWLESPWTDLADLEFPGEPLTAKDLEDFITDGSEQIEGHLDQEAQYEAIVDELVRFFVEHGYDIQEADFAILAAEALTVWCERHLHQVTPVPGALGQLLETIREQASQPEHPAWSAFLDHYFPAFNA